MQDSRSFPGHFLRSITMLVAQEMKVWARISGGHYGGGRGYAIGYGGSKLGGG